LNGCGGLRPSLDATPTEYAEAFRIVIRQRADALFVTSAPSNYANRRLVVDFATRHRLPSIHAYRESVELGGLMEYAADNHDLFRRAAGYIDKIFKGASLPISPSSNPLSSSWSST